MRHVLVMTTTSAIGLLTLFLVDLADIYFLSLLGEVEIAAAVGYAGTILFFTTSIGIGLSIAASALVSRALGQNKQRRAKRLTTNALMFSFIIGCTIGLLLWFAIPALLTLLGATGRAHELAVSYLRILMPSVPLLAIGMAAAALLRSIGDAKRAMYVTLSGGVVNAILDPLLIFTAGLGVDGAALASFAARVTVMAIGLYGLMKHHQMVVPPKLTPFVKSLPAIAAIALPAVATNVATPVGNAYVTAAISQFGDDAVAGWAIIGRLIPVVFAAIFALSGAIGPIVGQNIGAGSFDRVKSALTNALLFTAAYVLLAWIILALAHPFIASAFNASAEASSLIAAFAYYVVPLFGFLGALFVSNAAFNNLNRPHYSTLFNWGRATLGTIPFVMLGSAWFGARGVVIGSMLGSSFFGIAAIIACYTLIAKLSKQDLTDEPKKHRLRPGVPNWPFSSNRGLDP